MYLIAYLTTFQSTLPIEENSWRHRRLRSELKTLRTDPPEGIQAIPLDRHCCHWQASITGPQGSPYEGGLFFLYLQIPHRLAVSVGQPELTTSVCVKNICHMDRTNVLPDRISNYSQNLSENKNIELCFEETKLQNNIVIILLMYP